MYTHISTTIPCKMHAPPTIPAEHQFDLKINGHIYRAPRASTGHPPHPHGISHICRCRTPATSTIQHPYPWCTSSKENQTGRKSTIYIQSTPATSTEHKSNRHSSSLMSRTSAQSTGQQSDLQSTMRTHRSPAKSCERQPYSQSTSRAHRAPATCTEHQPEPQSTNQPHPQNRSHTYRAEMIAA